MSDMTSTIGSVGHAGIQQVYAGLGRRDIKRVAKNIRKSGRSDLAQQASDLLADTHPDFDRGAFMDQVSKRGLFRDRRSTGEPGLTGL